MRIAGFCVLPTVARINIHPFAFGLPPSGSCAGSTLRMHLTTSSVKVSIAIESTLQQNQMATSRECHDVLVHSRLLMLHIFHIHGAEQRPGHTCDGTARCYINVTSPITQDPYLFGTADSHTKRNPPSPIHLALRPTSISFRKSACVGWAKIVHFQPANSSSKIHQKHLREKWQGCEKNSHQFPTNFTHCFYISHQAFLVTSHISPIFSHFPIFPSPCGKAANSTAADAEAWHRGKNATMLTINR